MLRNCAIPLNSFVLELNGLTKFFPGVLANDCISLGVQRGEIHALLGENGAGKSTLVKMIYGVLRPDSGHMLLDGQPFMPTRPADARACGIGMVFQHFSLFEGLTVGENIALGVAPEYARGDLHQTILDVSESYGLRIDPDRFVGDLSAGERQRVEIVRCLLQNPRLIIMDEPTSVLTPEEVNGLFDTLRILAKRGCAILYISHKLEEIRTLCQAATILRDGKVVTTCVPARESAASLAAYMIGPIQIPNMRHTRTTGDTVLQIRDLSLPSETHFGMRLQNISLDLRAGEILGIAGVAGNGQDELMRVLTGERRTPTPDSITYAGQPIGHTGPDTRRRLGICSAPEERLGHAAVAEMSLVENALLTGRARLRLTQGGIVNWKKACAFTEQIIDRFQVRNRTIEDAAKTLSGGNLQKFVVGREIMQSPSVLIISQPTWGVDAGAAIAIRKLLVDLADNGAAVLIVSQDLDELMEIGDRIAVIANGHLSQPQAVDAVTVASIGTKFGRTTETADAS